MSCLETLRKTGKDFLVPSRIRIAVGMGTCGKIAGAHKVLKTIKEMGIDGEVFEVGCEGLCWAEPIVSISGRDGYRHVYGKVDMDIVSEIIEAELAGKRFEENYLGHTLLLAGSGSWPIEDDLAEAESTLPHAASERRIISWRCGLIRPESSAEYAATGGYRALEKLVSGEISAEEAIGIVEASGLRGRGGAGFPTGKKWKSVASSEDNVRYVIANADEGDPGAYMDRSLMEGNPHALIEGLAIAGFCLGARQAYVFTRVEYSRAAASLQRAIEDALAEGLLGEDILGSGWSFTISIVRSGGSYLCGEETALVAALENCVGVPRPKPPHPSEKGLWGHPTCVNNVETLANLGFILMHGSSAFCSLGTASSPGTKIFCVTGKNGRNGLVEVPLGTGIHEIVEYYNEARKDELKAFQIGGPSGSVLPIEPNIKLDFESLADALGIMGSGGIVMLSQTDCIVDTIRYYIGFSRSHSCGRCRCCKDGLGECLEILERIVAGDGTENDIVCLKQLCEVITDESQCGLGRAATRCLKSGLHYFGNEFHDHIAGTCPALICKPLIRFKVRENLCPGCRCCLPTCPSNAMRGKFGQPFYIDQRLCQKCWMCMSTCPYYAVDVVSAR